MAPQCIPKCELCTGQRRDGDRVENSCSRDSAPSLGSGRTGLLGDGIIGDRMRARGADAQFVEARLACNMLNRMTELGRPESYAIED